MDDGPTDLIEVIDPEVDQLLRLLVTITVLSHTDLADIVLFHEFNIHVLAHLLLLLFSATINFVNCLILLYGNIFVFENEEAVCASHYQSIGIILVHINGPIIGVILILEYLHLLKRDALLVLPYWIFRQWLFIIWYCELLALAPYSFYSQDAIAEHGTACRKLLNLIIRLYQQFLSLNFLIWGQLVDWYNLLECILNGNYIMVNDDNPVDIVQQLQNVE